MPAEKDLADIKNKIRRNKKVSGVWDKLEGTSDGSFVKKVTFQLEGHGKKATQLVQPREGGNITVVKGEIRNRRRKRSGHPTRATEFVSDEGKVTFLGERNF